MRFIYQEEWDVLSNVSERKSKTATTFADYSVTNRFISGTGVRFKNGPLSSKDSSIVLALLDSYLAEQTIDIAPNAVAKYILCKEAKYAYDYHSSTHVLSLLESKVKFIEYSPFHWKDKVLVANHVYEASLYDDLKFGTDKKKQFVDGALQKMISKINSIFGFDSCFTHVQVNIFLDEESFINVSI